jgi:uncharacterized protein (DUF1501 family)
MQLSALGVATRLAINLAAIGEAAAFDATDYKALVCIFLYGGNDYANTVVPYDAANYAKYHEIRADAAGEEESGIAFARADLAATALTPLDGAVLTDGLQYALAPQLVASMFDAAGWDQPRQGIWFSQRRFAVPVPIGANSAPKLFSHNDQQSVWQ